MPISMLLSLFLAALATLPALNNASCTKDSISVPGLRVGSKIPFRYTGHDLSSVTLSIVDRVGEIFHMELHHNKECNGNTPQVLFTAETYGRFETETDKVVEVPQLQSNLWWTVSAQENGWLIEQEDIGFSYTYEYSFYHLLSHVSDIKLYADEGCNVEDTKFEGLVLFEQKLNEFPNFEIQATCISNRDASTMLFFIGDNSPVGVQIFGEDSLLAVYGAGEYDETTLDEPITEDTIVTVRIERVEEDVSFLDCYVGDKSVSIDISQPDGPLSMQFVYFSNIQKMQIGR